MGCVFPYLYYFSGWVPAKDGFFCSGEADAFARADGRRAVCRPEQLAALIRSHLGQGSPFSWESDLGAQLKG